MRRLNGGYRLMGLGADLAPGTPNYTGPNPTQPPPFVQGAPQNLTPGTQNYLAYLKNSATGPDWTTVWDGNPAFVGSNLPSNAWYTQMPNGGAPQVRITTGDLNYAFALLAALQSNEYGGNGSAAANPWPTVFQELGWSQAQGLQFLQNVGSISTLTPGYQALLNSINGTNLPTEVTNFPAALDVQAGAMPGETQASPAPISPVSVSPVSVSTTAAVPASACGFALFGDTSCFTIGSVSIGQTTALVLGAAIVALFLMGGNR